MNPTMCVCIPTIGRSSFLGDTLNSVAKAWQPGLDLLVLDNSVEQSLSSDIFHTYGLHGTIYKTGQQISGTSNWNLSFTVGESEWVHILHDDDWVEPEFYKAALSDIALHPNAGVWMCATHQVCDFDPMLDYVCSMPTLFTRDLPFISEQLFTNSANRCVSTVIQRDAARQLGGFDGTMGFWFDLELFWSLAISRGAVFNSQVLGNYRFYAMSGTGFDPLRRKQRGLEDGSILGDLRLFLNKHRLTVPGLTSVRGYSRRLLIGAFRYHARRAQTRHVASCLRTLALHVAVFKGF